MIGILRYVCSVDENGVITVNIDSINIHHIHPELIFLFVQSKNKHNNIIALIIFNLFPFCRFFLDGCRLRYTIILE